MRPSTETFPSSGAAESLLVTARRRDEGHGALPEDRLRTWLCISLCAAVHSAARPFWLGAWAWVGVVGGWRVGRAEEADLETQEQSENRRLRAESKRLARGASSGAGGVETRRWRRCERAGVAVAAGGARPWVGRRGRGREVLRRCGGWRGLSLRAWSRGVWRWASGGVRRTHTSSGCRRRAWRCGCMTGRAACWRSLPPAGVGCAPRAANRGCECCAASGCGTLEPSRGLRRC